MSDLGRPNFVGENWLRYQQGLSFMVPPPSNSASDENLHRSEWMRLLCIFAQAQRGQFHNVHLLLELVSKSKDLEVRSSATCLIGHVATLRIRPQIAQFFLDPSYDLREKSISSAFYACDPDLVEPMLKARRVLKGEEAEWVMSTLNSMIEEETNEEPLILDDNEFEDDEAYESCVRRLRDDIINRVGSGMPIFNGGLLSVTAVSAVMEELCLAEDVVENGGAISYVYALFEAMTGVPSLGMFKEGVVPQALRILAMIEEFRYGTEMQKYQPGQRYFFGHPIP